MLHAAGWDHGHKLTLSVAPDASFTTTDVFVLLSGQDAVKLSLVTAPHRVVHLEVAAFLSQAQPLAGNSLLVRLDGWPAKRMTLTKTGVETIMKGRACSPWTSC